ncbi:MAG TPA: beta-N-acetylhexosaminidase [Thermoanaerobaculia bacterium]|nr:beta-N-acetylhexosaminidase [Thermoanaerobaculia bacterium]
MGARILGVGLTGPALTDLERDILRDSTPYALVLFKRNIESVEQLRDLVREIRSIASEPPLIMIDEEGGRVDRLRDLIPGLPGADTFGEGRDSKKLAGWFGHIVGKALRYFSIDVNLAPVVDLCRDKATKGLERRCFGRDAATVIDLAGAFMEGQELEGVGSCLKHFPGIGAGNADPHYGMSVVDLPLSTLIEEDLAPYRALGPQAGAVMVGHAIYPQLDDDRLPASLNPKIATDLLRRVVGFEGIVVSDDMEMHAVSDLASYEEISVRALLAGNDVVLFCSHVERVPELMANIRERAENDPLLASRYEEAVQRGIVYKRRCTGLQMSSKPLETFEDLMAEVERFQQAFRDAQPSDGARLDERRTTPRGGGSGKTGREEWT